MSPTVRRMQQADVPACTRILNDIVARGGTTAHETPFTEATFGKCYFEDPAVVHVVLNDGEVVGFQAVFDEGGQVYAIASFTDRTAPVRGAGRALFGATLEECRARGVAAILAVITSDNVPGLSYYSRMGFADDEVRPGAASRGGQPIDQIVKRYDLG